MFLGMSCIWVCHVFGYVMYQGMSCIWVCHVLGYVMSFGKWRKTLPLVYACNVSVFKIDFILMLV